LSTVSVFGCILQQIASNQSYRLSFKTEYIKSVSVQWRPNTVLKPTNLISLRFKHSALPVRQCDTDGRTVGRTDGRTDGRSVGRLSLLYF